MAQWLAELKGDKADLEYLCKLSSQRWRMIEQGGRYYLESADLDSSMDARDVLENASGTLDVMNGLARLVYRNFEGSKVSGISRVEKNGKPPTQFIMPSGIRSAARFGTVTIIEPSGQEPSQRPSIPGAKWIEIAEKDRLAARALALYGGRAHNWVNLYMVLEVVEDDVGGEKGLIGKRWAQKGKIKLFKRTADNFLSLGYEARHATEKYEAPNKPISLGDAESLIRNILERWLCSKL
jgi:hypothetical protein